jgi:hypothetical protein
MESNDFMNNHRIFLLLVSLLAIIPCSQAEAQPVSRVRGNGPTVVVVTVLPQALLTAPSFVAMPTGDEATVRNVVSDGGSDIRITPSYPTNDSHTSFVDAPARWMVESVAP